MELLVYLQGGQGEFSGLAYREAILMDKCPDLWAGRIPGPK
jgi:hypothetical protein